MSHGSLYHVQGFPLCPAARLRRTRPAMLLPLLVLFLVSFAQAQKDMGNIVGVVKDGSGAVVPGAQITIEDVERGHTLNVLTSTTGEYVSGPLKVGQYKVLVQKEGFKKGATEVQVDVQQRVPVNFTLQIGQSTQEVEVTGTAPQLETETSEMGEVVGRRQVSSLPLNGRNFAQLALLSTGTAPSEPGSRDETGYGFSAGGARSLQNNFLLDGVDNNSNLPDLLNETNFVIQPPVEALQEFKVQTNAYSAEFGRGNGAIINAVIRSGTNQFHGSVWEFLRNEKLDGRYYFDQVRQPYKQNQFGATFGGPIIKNRTFFFVDYEGLRVRQASPQVASVPTQAQRNGDFSSLLDYTSPVLDSGTGAPVVDCNGQPTYGGEIFNSRLAQPSAANPTGLCGTPFGYLANGLPSNVIPSGLIDPLAGRLTPLFPLPNAINAGFNYIANPIAQQNRNNADIRVDHNFTNSNTAFLRFSWEDQPSVYPSTFQSTGGDGGGFFSGIEDNTYFSLAVSDTQLITKSLINEFRFGYNHINSHRYQFKYDQDISAQYGFPGVPFNPINGGLPQLLFSDVSTLGSPTFLPSKELQNTYVFSDNLTWVRGRNTFKFGTEIRFEEFTIFQPAESRGTMSFGADFTGNPGTQTPVDANGVSLGSGSGFASFLLGAPDGGAINNMKNVVYHRPIYAFFAQDDLKLTPKLTLNLGLRYELFTTVKEANNQQGTYAFATESLVLPKGQNAQLTPYLSTIIPVQATGTTGLISPDLNNFAPRIGFAYALYPTTVIRAGYGIFYGGQENGPYSNPSPGFNPPYFVTQQWTTPCSLSSTNQALASQGLDCAIPDLRYLQNGFPASALTDPNTPILYSIDPALRTPYMQQWHLAVQQQLPWNTIFELGYAGSRGLKLFTFLNGNQATPTADPTIPLAVRRPVPTIDGAIQWFRSGGQSNYNSLQARLEKQFSQGLSFSVAYTWSHSLDIASNANLGAQNGGDFRDMRYPNAEYGNSDFDVRQRLVINYLYDLPFGHGQRFAGDATGAYNALIGGWQIAGITNFSTGNWFTVTSAAGVSNADGGGNVGTSDRPNLIGDPLAKPCVPGTYFNTCAFGIGTPGTFGNVGRNTIQGPGYEIWDFSIFKSFAIKERQQLQFRADFFNLFNHFNPLFARSGPQNANNATVFNPSNPGLFGVITAARSPRQIQLAIKYSF